MTPSLLATALGQVTRNSKPSPAPLGFSVTTWFSAKAFRSDAAETN